MIINLKFANYLVEFRDIEISELELLLGLNFCNNSLVVK